MADTKELSAELREELLSTLKARFDKNTNRHKDLEWTKVHEKMDSEVEKLWSLNEMEITGGEPDVVDIDKNTGEYIFMIVRRKPPKAAEVFVMTGKR